MGRVSREQAAQNRQRVVEAAVRLLRKQGLQGVGIAELMAEAGLTHGGFYRHFASKDAMAAEACSQATAQSVKAWESAVAGSEPGESRLDALAEFYLGGASHRRCPLAALAGDVSREPLGSPVRDAFTRGTAGLAGVLQSCLPEDEEAPARRDRALGVLAALIGAAVLSRAVDDPQLGEEIRTAARRLVAETVEGSAG